MLNNTSYFNHLHKYCCSDPDLHVITVFPGNLDSIVTRAEYIMSGVPSKNFPHPPTNRVSPVNIHITAMKYTKIQPILILMIFSFSSFTCKHLPVNFYL